MGDFTGTAALTRLALRRDRILLPSWIVGFALMVGVSASATVGLYPDESQRVSAAETVNATTALVALYGPIYDPTSLGALSMFKLTALGAAIMAVLAVFVVVRHTRAEEETGRLELFGAAPTGRLAPLAAAYIVTFGASLAIGLVSAAALVAAGLPVTGSLAFGLGWAGSGIAFGALAGVLAQVTTGARARSGVHRRGLRHPRGGRRRRGWRLVVVVVADRVDAAGARIRRGPLVGAVAAAGDGCGLRAGGLSVAHAS